ncbi:hypothetical protein ES703_04294 [subsurface metagenome]
MPAALIRFCRRSRSSTVMSWAPRMPAVFSRRNTAAISMMVRFIAHEYMLTSYVPISPEDPLPYGTIDRFYGQLEVPGMHDEEHGDFRRTLIDQPYFDVFLTEEKKICDKARLCGYTIPHDGND